jgi:parallel beta-helix repeat protein
MKQFIARLFGSRSRSSRPARSRLLLEKLEDRTVPTAITVTLTTDPAGAHTGVSLRDAIKAVNQGKDDTINFNIPGTGAQVISVNSDLPVLTRKVTIDATTEPGYSTTPVIGLTRGKNSVKGDALTFKAGATVKGLAVYGFASWGLVFKGNGNTASGDYVGVTPSGAAAGNGYAGIYLFHANNDSITGNTVSNNGHRGINVEGSAHVTVSGNTVSNNGPGDPGWAGIVVHGGSWDVTVSGNTITGNGRGIRVSQAGGTLPPGASFSIFLTNNTITGNRSQGILIDNGLGGPAANVLLTGNDVENNSTIGIWVNHSSNVTFTGDTVSNNKKDGINIGQGSTKVLFTRDNVIKNNGGAGVHIVPKAVASPDTNLNTITGNTQGNIQRG